jgi:hypothetical protein
MPIACYRATWYGGDGQLSDAGFLVLLGHRYTLDLGPVDLRVAGTRTYHLRRLPSTGFAAGIKISEVDTNLLESLPEQDARVRIQVTTADGKVAVLEDVPLREWAWSHALGGSEAFLYRRGRENEIPLGGGGVRIQRIDLKASNGWGTYFDAKFWTWYDLTVEVVEPAPSAAKPARVVLHGYP